MKRRTLLLAAASAGCAESQPAGLAVLAPGLLFRPPGPDVLGATAQVAQSVHAVYPFGSLAFESQIALTPEALTLVALDSFGRRLITLEWRSGALAAERAPFLPASIRPANLLADLALIHWPATALNAALAPAGAELQCTPTGREVRFREETVIAIQGTPAWQGRVLYRNLAFRYSLAIQSVLLEP